MEKKIFKMDIQWPVPYIHRITRFGEVEVRFKTSVRIPKQKEGEEYYKKLNEFNIEKDLIKVFIITKDTTNEFIGAPVIPESEILP